MIFWAIWMFPKIEVVNPPKWMVYNGKPENPVKMDDLGVPLFLETPIIICHANFAIKDFFCDLHPTKISDFAQLQKKGWL